MLIFSAKLHELIVMMLGSSHYQYSCDDMTIKTLPFGLELPWADDLKAVYNAVQLWMLSTCNTIQKRKI